MDHKSRWSTIIAWVIFAVFVVLVIFGVRSYMDLNGQITALSRRVADLEGQKVIQVFDDQLSIFDYMKNEQELLIWIVGLVLAGVSGMLAFFGLATRKDMEANIREKYEESYQKSRKEMEEALQESKKDIENTKHLINEKYEKVFEDRLQGAIEKEKRAKQKPMLFVYQGGDENQLRSTADYYHMCGYTVNGISADEFFASANTMQSRIEDSSIVIYQIDPSEAIDAKKPKQEVDYETSAESMQLIPHYLGLAGACEAIKRYCIIYTGAYRIDMDKLSQFGRSLTVNFPVILRERLHSLLYFTP